MNNDDGIADTVCQSTHGGAGYAPGSYWDGDAMICGFCGVRIVPPYLTSHIEYYHFTEAPLKWLRREAKSVSYFCGGALVRLEQSLDD